MLLLSEENWCQSYIYTDIAIFFRSGKIAKQVLFSMVCLGYFAIVCGNTMFMANDYSCRNLC